MDEGLAFRVGLFMGELAKNGIHAEPVVDKNGYTDEVRVTLDEPFDHITLRVKVSIDGE
jgi:hypothetical protein